jgi:hypothetical protein
MLSGGEDGRDPPGRAQALADSPRHAGRSRPTVGPLLEADAIAVWILHIHLARSPSLVDRGQINRTPSVDEFPVQEINVVNDNIRHASNDPVSSQRGQVQFNLIAREAQVTGIRIVASMREVEREAEPVAVEILGFDRGLNV